MADVFLSYARSDRPCVEQLAEALAKAGFSAWWDREIISGEEFSGRIEAELQEAGAVVVAWSAAGSQSNWVKDEAAFGAQAGKLFAVSLDGTLPPLGFRQYHCIDLSAWKGQAEATPIAALVHSLTVRLPGKEAGEPVAPNVTSAPAPSTGKPDSPADDAPWIAVTPFKVRGSDPDLPDLADDLVDSISGGLARFSYLNVSSQASASAGEQAGASYVLEGALRASGTRLRLSMRLNAARSGRQVWAEHYNRPWDADRLFELQDDLTDHVVAAVADAYGALMRDLATPVLAMDPAQFTPYQALIRYFVYRQRVGPEDHLIALQALERAAEQTPGNAELLAALSLTIMEEFKHGFNLRDGALERSYSAAKKAVEADPQSAHAWFALAEAHFFRQDTPGMVNAAERSLELNPRDSDAMAMLANYFCFNGDYLRGVALAERARALNPNHPGWYWFPNFFKHFSAGEYERALGYAERVNLPQYYGDAEMRAATHALLGNQAEAARAAEEFEALLPMPVAELREFNMRWHYRQPQVMDRLEEGLRKAGVDMP